MATTQTESESVSVTPSKEAPIPSAPELSDSATPKNGESVTVTTTTVTPVFSAEPSTPNPGIRVLIAVDDSPQSALAVEWYAKYIHKPGNDVILAHCSSVKMPDYNASPGLMKELTFKAEAQCSEIGRAANETMGKYGARGKFVTLLGKPAESIVEAVFDRHVNMVIIGKRHLSKLKKKMSGSVSSHVISHANVPVLVCPAPKTQKSHKS